MSAPIQRGLVLVAVVATIALGSMSISIANAQQRGIPRAARTVLEGCWVPWAGERWTFTRSGERGLQLTSSLDVETLRERFGRASMPHRLRSSVTWVSERNAAQIGCGPVTQHGQFCMLSVEDDGSLTVRLYARGHGERRHRGRLISTTRILHCTDN